MYTTQEMIEAALNRDLTANEVDIFNSILDDSVDKYINTETETVFGSSEEVTLYVSGDQASDLLIIPTMHDISEVKCGGAAIDSTSYWSSPRGADFSYALYSGDGWVSGFENYAIKGIRGYRGVPSEISVVATEIAVNFFAHNVNAGSDEKSEKVGDWSVVYRDVERTVSDRAKLVLASYRRLSRGI